MLVRVRFRDGSEWEFAAERHLERWSALESEDLMRVGRRCGDVLDDEDRLWFDDDVRARVLRPSAFSDPDRHTRRDFLDWLTLTFGWPELRARLMDRPRRHERCDYAREWPRADLALVGGEV